MRRMLAAAASVCLASAALGHITPNVELVRKGDFLKQGLPGATKFFERHLMISGPDGAAIRAATNWSPSEEDTRVYVGRDEQKKLIGSVVFLWMPSQHGPVGVAVAFDPARTVRRVAVTDVGSEPLAWVRPLVEGNGLRQLEGLPAGSVPDPGRLAPADAGAMTRYYARVVADAVIRAQRIAALAAEEAP